MEYKVLIEEKGYITEGDVIRVYDKPIINISRIFSFLIKEVGTKVSSYQSDLFYDLTRINHAINNLESGVFYIGLRDTGIDGNDFCLARNYKGYINVYVVVVDVDTNSNAIRLTLSEKISEKIK